jgi:hypothetical protein
MSSPEARSSFLRPVKASKMETRYYSSRLATGIF